MSDNTITSANSVFTITAPKLFPAPVQLRGYASDKAFATEAVVLSEVLMGVDGIMSAGYTPTPVTQTVTLQSDSSSRTIFDAVIADTKTSREIYLLSGTITLPSTGEDFTLTRGVLTQAKQIPDAQKMLQPVDYTIIWESVNRSLI